MLGSYARGEANPDMDFRLDKGAIRGYFQLCGFNIAIEEAFGMKVDLVVTGSLEDEFLARIADDDAIIYDFFSYN